MPKPTHPPPVMIRLLFIAPAALGVATLGCLLWTWLAGRPPRPPGYTDREWQMQNLASIRYPALGGGAALTAVWALLQVGCWVGYRLTARRPHRPRASTTAGRHADKTAAWETATEVLSG